MSGLTEKKLNRLISLDAVNDLYFKETEVGYILMVRYGEVKEEPLRSVREEFRLFKRPAYAIDYVKDLGFSSVTFYFEE